MSDSEIFDYVPQNPGTNRIGRGGLFYEWNESKHDEFIEWWTTTPWAVKHSITSSDTDITKSINWNSKTKTSLYWSNYYQGAHRCTGEPVLVCRECANHIAHPNIKNSKTKAIKNYL